LSAALYGALLSVLIIPLVARLARPLLTEMSVS